MKFIISGKNIEVTEGLRKAINEKLGKLERYFTPETEIHVTLSVEKERQKIEVTIPVKGNIIRSEQVSSDMYVSIDLVEEVIERQAKEIVQKQEYRRDLANRAVDDKIFAYIQATAKIDYKNVSVKDFNALFEGAAE